MMEYQVVTSGLVNLHIRESVCCINESTVTYNLRDVFVLNIGKYPSHLMGKGVVYQTKPFGLARGISGKQQGRCERLQENT
jgi:hypothetical protein